MSSTDSITVIVPALNEERGLAGSVAMIREAVAAAFADYEILIFDDGSTDRTGVIADELAARYAEVRVFHHATPHCIGGVMRSGWTHARMRYAIWVDGQGATRPEALARIFAERGRADLVVPFASNQHERPWLRQTIARTFRGILNLLFGLDLHQYTHLLLCDPRYARRFRIRTDSYAFQAEAIIKMIKAGASYVEVGVEDNFRIEGRRSKAFRLKNVTGVAAFLTTTLWDVYVRRGDLPAGPDAADAADSDHGARRAGSGRTEP